MVWPGPESGVATAVIGAYAPAAVLYCSTTLAGTRPRSLISMPCSLAHSRTLAVSTASFARRPRGARLAVPPVRRPCLTYCSRALRSSYLDQNNVGKGFYSKAAELRLIVSEHLSPAAKDAFWVQQLNGVQQ